MRFDIQERATHSGLDEISGSSSSSGCPSWHIIVHGRHLQSQPSVFTMEISSPREVHVECSTALLIKKQMLCPERVRNSSSLGCWHTDAAPPMLPVLLGGGAEGVHSELFALLHYLHFEIVPGINCYCGWDLISINSSNSLIVIKF